MNLDCFKDKGQVMESKETRGVRMQRSTPEGMADIRISQTSVCPVGNADSDVQVGGGFESA